MHTRTPCDRDESGDGTAKPTRPDSLSGEVGRGGDAVGDGDTDVQLGDGDLEALASELGHGLGEVLCNQALSVMHPLSLMFGTLTRGETADKVALKADAVERRALGEQLVGQRGHRLRLGVDTLNVVVVDVQPDVGRRGVRVVELRTRRGTTGSDHRLSCERTTTYRQLDIVLAEDIVPHVLLVRAVLVERLIDHVDGVQIVLVAAHHDVDVVLEHGLELGRVRDRGHVGCGGE